MRKLVIIDTVMSQDKSFRLVLYTLNSKGGAHIFLYSQVWFVPCLNFNEETVFHIFILQKSISEKSNVYEKIQLTGTTLTYFRVSERNLKTAYRHNWNKRSQKKREEKKVNTFINVKNKAIRLTKQDMYPL